MSEEYKCPYCGRVFDSFQALGGHKAHCPEKDEHRMIEVEMTAGLWNGNKEFIKGKKYSVTQKFYKSHKHCMKPTRHSK